MINIWAVDLIYLLFNNQCKLKISTDMFCEQHGPHVSDIKFFNFRTIYAVQRQRLYLSLLQLFDYFKVYIY
jgi:hypothetical protein